MASTYSEIHLTQSAVFGDEKAVGNGVAAIALESDV